MYFSMSPKQRDQEADSSLDENKNLFCVYGSIDLKTTWCGMMQSHVNSLILEHSVTVPEHATQTPFPPNTICFIC